MMDTYNERYQPSAQSTETGNPESGEENDVGSQSYQGYMVIYNNFLFIKPIKSFPNFVAVVLICTLHVADHIHISTL